VAESIVIREDEERSSPPPRPSRLPAEGRAGWIVLGLLLLATLAAAVLFDRTGRPSLVGDEATYAMQAASLAYDFDLAYTKADYDRFVAQWGGPPDGLILQSRDQGTHITYGKPPLYALAAAPFVRFAPVRGAVIANALLLALASILAARALRTRIGPAAPLWVAAFVFASVTFAYVFWVHADLFLLTTTVAGFALAYGAPRERQGPMPDIYQPEDPTPAGRVFGRWLLVGLLVAAAGAFRPFYLALLLPALLAARGEPDGRRRSRVLGVLAGAFLLLAAAGLLQWGAGGHWSGYGGERQGFYPRTGYPDVEFPRAEWEKSVQRWGNTSWLQVEAYEPKVSGKLLGWDALYFLIGRNVGVLPYFLPLLLGFAAYSRKRGRWAIVLAVLAAVVCFFLVRPFNFYGGGGSIANRYFLPLYGALWFLAARPARASWALITVALAAPFLYPLWLHPEAFPIGSDGRYAHVSPVAQRILPYETTQSHIPGGQDVGDNGLWLKLLSSKVWRTEGVEGLRMTGDGQADILVGSPQPLKSLLVEVDRTGPSHLLVGQRELQASIFRPSGAVVFEVPLDHARAIHPMWWTWNDFYLYELHLRLPGGPATPVGVRLYPDQDLIQRSKGREK
jgi:hypothetical protein